jgi:hypothetical protein
MKCLIIINNHFAQVIRFCERQTEYNLPFIIQSLLQLIMVTLTARSIGLRSLCVTNLHSL